MGFAGQLVGSVIVGLPDQRGAVNSKHPHTGQAGCVSSTHRPFPGASGKMSLPRCFGTECVRSFSKTNGSDRQGPPFLLGLSSHGVTETASGWSPRARVGRWPVSRSSWRCMAGKSGAKHACSLWATFQHQADLHKPPSSLLSSLPASHSPAWDRPSPSDTPRRCLRPLGWELRSTGLSQASWKTRESGLAQEAPSQPPLPRIYRQDHKPALPVLAHGRHSPPYPPSGPVGSGKTSQRPGAQRS